MKNLVRIVLLLALVSASGVGASGNPAQEIADGVWTVREAGDNDFAELTACVPGEFTACLQGGRFTIRFLMDWGSAEEIRAHVQGVPETSSVSFWAYSSDNPEITVKVLDACAINGRYWIFAGGLTDRSFLLEVRDAHNNVAYYGKFFGYMVSWKDIETNFPCE